HFYGFRPRYGNLQHTALHRTFMAQHLLDLLGIESRFLSPRLCRDFALLPSRFSKRSFRQREGSLDMAGEASGIALAGDMEKHHARSLTDQMIMQCCYLNSFLPQLVKDWRYLVFRQHEIAIYHCLAPGLFKGDPASERQTGF